MRVKGKGMLLITIPIGKETGWIALSQNKVS